jgi:hypothetical protein
VNGINSQEFFFGKINNLTTPLLEEEIMRHTIRILVPLVLMVIMAITTGVPTVEALVEEDWPAGTPNVPRNPDDIFIDFETGIDGIEIESTIPALQFTTTSGLDWVYGDIRTGVYNVRPYNEGAYETNGNFFAWLGTTGDIGRIDFLGGGATYCSVLVSTSSGLAMDAYNSEDTYISTSGWASSNIYTETFTRLTVDAPAGETIAYVLIHDTGNFWLIDDLCSDANKAVVPVPDRTIGDHDDRFDLIFVPDEDYGLPADIDTWLPDFIDDIQDQIDLRLDAADPVNGNLDDFNFYYARSQGDSPGSDHILPADLTRMAPFADAYCILHTTSFGDWMEWGPPVKFSAEGEVGRSFIHEAGHGIFGLADEYDDAPDCRTGRFEPDPMPNVWDTEADGRADATSEGWDPDDIWEFTTCHGDWWKLGTTSYIMKDGNHFANGWGDPASRRIEWFLDQYPGAGAGASTSGYTPEADKSIWLNLEVDGGVFYLIDESFVVDSPPEYLPGEYEFTANYFSNGGELLGEYGFRNPRINQAESGYEGPIWEDSANSQLILPYFANCGRVDVIESSSGIVELSVDISQYATVFPPVVAIISPASGSALQDGVTFTASVTDESAVASITFSIREDDGGEGIPVGFEDLVPNYNPGTGIATLMFDTLQLPDGYYLLVITATDDDGNSTTIRVPYTIYNWVVIEQLPSTPNSKAGRTMPVKFSLRVAESVDPSQPFVYNEELTIKIYATSDPDRIMQISEFGERSRDYRIDELAEHYITNFKTSKRPNHYTVEIWRTSNNFMVGSFTFETVR